MPDNKKRSEGYGREATRELVAKLLKTSIPTLLVSLLTALATTSILLSESNRTQLGIWCSVVVLISVVRLFQVWRWRKLLSPENAIQIARLYTLGAFVAGLSWSFILYFYSPDGAQLSQLMVLVILTCLSPAGLAANSHWLPVFYAFSIPLWVASIAWAILFGEGKQLQLFLIIFVYISLIVAVAFRTGETLKQLIYEVYRNKELVREVREANDKLNLLAYEDPLTRLANRRQFEEKAIEAMGLLEDMRISKIVLLVIDVDNFKSINDKLGHDAGDQLLIDISNRMMEMSRHSEVVVQGQMNTARIGGDEFAVMYCIDNNHANSSIDKLAQRVLGALSEAISFESQVFWPSVSIGVAQAPAHATEFAELRRHADGAMYQAKKEGGNRVCIYQQPHE